LKNLLTYYKLCNEKYLQSCDLIDWVTLTKAYLSGVIKVQGLLAIVWVNVNI
jgi:hypothetical protein